VSDQSRALEALQREVAQLQERMKAMERKRGAVAKAESELRFDYVRFVEEAAAKQGDKVAVGVFRGVVMMGPEGGTGSSAQHGVWTSPITQPPTEEQVRGSLAMVLGSDPFAMRALFYLFQPFYDGKPMRLTKSALAATLNVSEAGLEERLRPVVAKGTVRRTTSADGEDAYELEGAHDYLALLAMALEGR
jgi:hypothetical protein